jgi:SNW domain-containing protein 1
LRVKEIEERVKLRELAMTAREERGGGFPSAVAERSEDHNQGHIIDRTSATPLVTHASDDKSNDESEDEYEKNTAKSQLQGNIIPDDTSTIDDEAQQREHIRQERRRERERKLRLERQELNRRSDDDDNEEVAIKKARLGNQDVSEKIALGVHTGSGGDRGGVDGRLYNQSAGLDVGFGADDEYTTYSKPMFDREGVTRSSIYRPTGGEGAMDADEQYNKLKSGATSRFQPDKGFKGAEGGDGMTSNGVWNAPVQFEKIS